MVWTVQTNRFQTQWQENYERLQVYQQEHGTTLVTHTLDHALASWVERHRNLHAQQKLLLIFIASTYLNCTHRNSNT